MSAVVVGYIASPEGDAAVVQGIIEAKLRNCSIVVVNSDHGDRLDSLTTIERAASLDAVRARLQDAEVEHEVRHLVRGHDPVTDVLDVAEQVHAELIVIGIRRRTPVGKLVLGSTSQSILLEATIPVLAVKA